MTSHTRSLLDLPHAPGRLPVLGDVTSVNRRTPTQHELHLSRQLGPIFQRKLLSNQLVFVAGSDLANQCADEDNWARALAGPGEKARLIAEDGLFTVRTSNPIWGHARQILSPGFTQEAMRVHHTAMLSVADDLSTAWAADPDIDAHDAMTRATLEVIARAGFSRSLGLYDSVDSPGIDGAAAFIPALARTLAWTSESTNDLPVIGPLRSALTSRQRNRDITLLRDLVDSVVQSRSRGDDVTKHDLLQLMLDEPPSERLPEANIRNQILTFLVAGHETTASLLEAALHYIAADHALQQRLRDEALTAQKTNYDYKSIAGLRDIRAVINEVLRLWPPLPGQFRVARSDQTLGGYLVPQGKVVLLLTLAAQRDPSAWGSDSDDFQPFRTRPRRDSYFRPWGIGPRSCIGRAFATHEATLLLAYIVSEFTLSLPDRAELSFTERGTLRPAPYRLTALKR